MANKVHIRRGALPWRGEEITECGRQTSNSSTMSVAELVRESSYPTWPERRTSICNVCFDRANLYWRRQDSATDEVASDVLAVVRREVERTFNNRQDRERFKREMEAIGILVAENRERFDFLLSCDAEFLAYCKHVEEFETYRAWIMPAEED